MYESKRYEHSDLFITPKTEVSSYQAVQSSSPMEIECPSVCPDSACRDSACHDFRRRDSCRRDSRRRDSRCSGHDDENCFYKFKWAYAFDACDPYEIGRLNQI